MKLTRTLLTSTALLAPFAGLAAGQDDPPVPPTTRRGLFSGTAVAIWHPLPSDSLTPAGLLFSPPGDQSTPPTPFDPSAFTTTVDYTLSKMFPNHYLDIEIDALSTGNDYIGPVSEDGWADLLTVSRWQTVTVSVDEDASGTPGSLLRQEPLLGEGVEGSILGHYLVDSQGISGDLVDTTQLEQSSGHLGFQNPGDDAIGGMDFGMAVLANAGGSSDPSPAIFRQGEGEFYFSVTTDWAGRYPTDFALGVVATRGADIYKIAWLGTGWSTPVRVIMAETLGLDGATEDLDGLAYEPANGTVVYSTVGFARPSQLLVYSPDSPQGPEVVAKPYRDGNGKKVTKKLGLRDVSDDIKAICILDPEPDSVDRDLGILITHRGSYALNCGLSVERWVQPIFKDGRSTINVQATGLGGASAANVEVEFFSYEVSNGTWGTQIVPYDFVRGAAEWSFSVTPLPGGNKMWFAATLWEVAGDGSRSVIGKSWKAKLEF
jgi:hypothetical protein